jgi:protein-tyrosine kinase
MSTDVPWGFVGPSAPVVACAATGAAGSPALADVSPRLRADSRGLSTEQLTPLVRRLLQSTPDERRLRSVLFSAIGSDVVSAELCAAAGDTLASQTTGSVCLVDGNLRSPSLHSLFGVANASGLSDLLLQAGDPRGCLTRLRANLWLLPAGSHGNQALPHLVAERVRPVLVKLNAAFDYVVLDTSAAGAHGDATVLGRLVDGVILVVEANATRREVARRTTEQLQAASVSLLGAVLTNRTFPIPEAIYRTL